MSDVEDLLEELAGTPCAARHSAPGRSREPRERSCHCQTPRITELDALGRQSRAAFARSRICRGPTWLDSCARRSRRALRRARRRSVRHAAHARRRRPRSRRATARASLRSDRRSSCCASSSATCAEPVGRCRSRAARSATSATTSAGGSSASRRSPPPTSRCRISPSGIYDWAVVVDHAARRTWLVGNGRDPRTFERWSELVARLSPSAAAGAAAPFRVLRRAASSNFSRAAYAAAFRSSPGPHPPRRLLSSESRRSASRRAAEGDAWHAYLRLREINPAPFAAYLDLPDGKIVVLVARAVPARYATATSRRNRSRARGRAPTDPVRDRALADELRTSAEGPRRERHDRRPACATISASAACRARCA